MELEESECGVQLGAEHAAEPRDLGLIPTAGVANLCALEDETKRAACLAALRRSFLLFVCCLITEEIGPQCLPIDGGGRISSMLRPPGLDYGALGIAQGKAPPGSRRRESQT